MSTVVAIDGPAGAGKSTVARMVADHLHYAYINTGSLYRALAYAAMTSGIAFEEITPGFLQGLQLEFCGADLYLNGKKLDTQLRKPECAKGASVVSAKPFVRDYLMPVQRQAADGQWIVMEGRDIGTVVFPDAEKKFFVTASAEERARRRMAQSSEVADGATFESILADIKARDERDMNREIAPLKQADDAVLIDTTGLSIDEVVAKIASYCKN
ncbi:MAG: (d)CMP kinase [Lentisphaerae bacterium]|nr:(d)CMP kinase [Lentisphaerota bacterium]